MQVWAVDASSIIDLRQIPGKQDGSREERGCRDPSDSSGLHFSTLLLQQSCCEEIEALWTAASAGPFGTCPRDLPREQPGCHGPVAESCDESNRRRDQGAQSVDESRGPNRVSIPRFRTPDG